MKFADATQVAEVVDRAEPYRLPNDARVANARPDHQRVLIVVPCLDEAANLPDLLPQLAAENPAATIVVVDGGSTDGSRAIVSGLAQRLPGLRLLDNPHRIQSAGINLAVAAYGDGHDWLVRVDAHCRYPAGFVPMLLAAADRRHAASVVVPMVTRGDSCFQRAAAAAQNSIIGTGGASHRRLGDGGYVDHGHHALFALATFTAAGGYDDSFPHNEDAELDTRLTARGVRIWLEPGAALVYAPRRTPQALFRQYVNYGRGRARTVAKHRLPLKLRQTLPLLVLPAAVLAVLGTGLAFFLAPAFGVLALPALAWATCCAGFGLWMGVRDRSRCAALGGLAAMIMHLGWSMGYWQMRFSGSVQAATS
ncbi:glycosyltransferase [Polymorphobacter fuscus]|uniref:Glycosyltransferase n=1 Tax=Sandarakinorhabdus fusca TaxID=1439888 RepID=A0A7C9GP43_9SPHN|nr:glycosyltransferase family 2 protein [Polymorphobacter fuscus]KAB7648047.1 glycosyltransferase family 2 protein [Polymorphobacter fuscus]MQT17252.1 glycosyltransferase [Polymorphobacter fuscus]